MNAEDVPTEGGDPAASPAPTTTGPAPPKRFRRAARPTAVTALEDLMPRELFRAHVIGGGHLLPTMLASVATVNRSFKDTLYQPKVIMYRAAIALTEVSALAEAKKWYEIAAERFTCREALVMLVQTEPFAGRRARPRINRVGPAHPEIHTISLDHAGDQPSHRGRYEP